MIRTAPFLPHRRSLLAGLAGAVTLALLGLTPVRQPDAKATSAHGPEGMVLREIPRSGERIPAAGMGSYRSFNISPRDTEGMARMRAVLRAFLDGGGRVMDSSPMYGESERVLGLLAAELEATDMLWMATKVWTTGREAGVQQMRTSMNLLGTDPMDLMQVHNLLDVDTHLGTLQEWREEGRIRHLGITHYQARRHDDLVKLIERHPLDFVQFNYNVLDRNAERRLLPACRHHGVATLINEPFGQGRLFRRVGEQPVPAWAAEIRCHSWAQLFLKFLISHPDVTAVIPATSNPAHAADNVAAGREPLPDRTLRERIADAVSAA
ncbi:MAG: aldo/keto reductase [Ectothiorhodospiraceae bacterium]|nr:aldo/keto reductase [Ectothiorhodospiraceae bacterium]